MGVGARKVVKFAGSIVAVPEYAIVVVLRA